MDNKFIWNLDQDRIHFVNSFDFEKPLEDDYIMGDYFDAGKSITLYGKGINVPINLDYFLRLWRASEPDKEIKRDRIEIVNTSPVKKETKVKVSAQEQKFLSIVGEMIDDQMGAKAVPMLERFVQSNPRPEDVRNLLLPFLADWNSSIMDKFFPDNFPSRPEEWKNLSEEEVFNYIEEYSRYLNPPDQETQMDLINGMMDRWFQTGVPVDVTDHVVDEASLNWNKITEVLNSKFGGGVAVQSKWKKVADYNGWTNWETWNTKLMMDNEYEIYKHFRKMIADGDPFEEFVNHAIQMVVAPYNQNLLEDFQSMTDEEEIETKLQHDLEDWQADAKRKYPDDPYAQEEYVEKMKSIVYGLMGEPEPTDIANHWLDESKINWEEIYESMKSDWEEEQEYERKNSKWSKYDSEELKKGIEVEKEHKDTVGNDPKVWEEIAKDHLDEIPDYYTRIKKIEKNYKEIKKRNVK